jgi:hypothetical protein
MVSATSILFSILPRKFPQIIHIDADRNSIQVLCPITLHCDSTLIYQGDNIDNTYIETTFPGLLAREFNEVARYGALLLPPHQLIANTTPAAAQKLTCDNMLLMRGDALHCAPSSSEPRGFVFFVINPVNENPYSYNFQENPVMLLFDLILQIEHQDINDALLPALYRHLGIALLAFPYYDPLPYFADDPDAKRSKEKMKKILKTLAIFRKIV